MGINEYTQGKLRYVEYVYKYMAHWQVKKDNENVNNIYLINERIQNETNQEQL